MMNQIKYAYSTDQETFYGEFDTESDALAEGSSCTDPGCTVWVGEIVYAMDLLRKRTWLAEDCIDRMNDSLSDDIGGDDYPVEMSQEKLLELNALILDFVEKNASFVRWGVKNTKELVADRSEP
jgi:hypothetical protein